MSDSSVSVSITADTSKLSAGLTQAKTDAQLFAQALAETGNSMKAASVRFLELQAAAQRTGPAIEQATAAVKNSGTANDTAANAAKTLTNTITASTTATQGMARAVETETGAMVNNGVAREAMVIAHELLQGRFNRVAGSLMVMTERMGGASMAMMGLVGVFAVAAAGAAHLVEWLNKVSEAKLLAEAGGLGSGVSNTQADAAVSALRKLSGVSSEEAGKIANSYLQMRGVTAPVLEELTAVTQQFGIRTGEGAAAAASKIVSAYGMNANAATELMTKTRATTAATEELQQAITRNDVVRARSIILHELSRSAREVDTETRAATRTTTELNAAMAAAKGANLPSQSAAGAMLRSPVVDTKAVDEANRLKAALASVNAEMATPAAQSWSSQMSLSLEKATLETEQSAHAQGKSWQQIHEAMAQTTVTFWTKQVAETTAGTKNREEAERHYYRAVEQLDMLRIRQSEVGSRKTLQEQLAALNEQQAANHDNFTVVMQLEQQKLGLIEAAHGKASADYQNELKRQEDMLRAHNAKLFQASEQDLANRRTVSAREIAEKKADLDTQVAMDEISKVRAVAILRQFAAEKHAIDLADLQAFEQTLNGQAAAVQKVQEQIKAIKAKYAADDKALNRIAAQDLAQQYSQAFAGVKTAFDGAIQGVIQGTQTLRQLVANFGQSVVLSYARMGVDAAARWAQSQLMQLVVTKTTEAAKTAATETGAAARATADSSGGFISAIGSMLARWLGLEAAKTGATDAGAASRAIADGAAATAGAVAVATAARAEIEAFASVAAAAAFADSASLGPVGLAAAPEAAAGAYAAVSAFQLSVPGLAVGAYDVPGDMLAQIHKGEMVVPANFSDGIRAGAVSLGGPGGGGGSAPNFAIHLSAIDTQSGMAFLNANAAALAKTVSRHLRMNPSTR